MMQSKSNLEEYILVLCVTGGVFTSVMSTSMLVINFKELTENFNVSFVTFQWRNILFFLFFALNLPLTGKLSSYIGVKKQYTLGLVLFILSSFFSGQTKNWNLFLFLQSCQGFADSLIVSCMPILIRQYIPENKLGWAFGLESSVLATASLIGPPLGTMITNFLGWEYIFYTLASFSTCALAVSTYFIPNDRLNRTNRADLPILSTISLFIILLGTQLYIFEYLTLISSIILVVGGSILLGIKELNFKNKEKLISKSMLRNRVFKLGILRICLLSMTSNIVFFLSPTYFRVIHGVSAKTISWVIMLDALIPMLLGVKIGQLTDFNPKATLKTGILFSLLPLLIFIFFTKNLNLYLIITIYLLIGMGTVFVNSSQMKIVLPSMPTEETGDYMGLYYLVCFASGGIVSMLYSLISTKLSYADFKQESFLFVLIACSIFNIVALLTVFCDDKKKVEDF